MQKVLVDFGKVITLFQYNLNNTYIVWISLFSNISGYRLRNFEVRVGQDGTDIGNNALCYKQLDSIPDGTTADFQCYHPLYGNWVSVNKTDTAYEDNTLQLREVRVFGG